MTKSDIKSLMEKATIGEDGFKWVWNGGGFDFFTVRENGEASGYHSLAHSGCDLNEQTRGFIAALPAIASTAIAALERVEELEKEIERLEDEMGEMNNIH